MEYTKTELHTHLLGILTPIEFLQFIKDIGIDSIIWPFDDNKEYDIDLLLSDSSYYDLLNANGVVDYEFLDILYASRTSILKDVVKKYKTIYKLSSKENEKTVYNLFINECLRSLVNNGVEYTEISYSFPDRIANFIMDPDLVDKIKVRFLLSTSRRTLVKSIDPKARTFEKSARDLEKVLDGPNAVGFDIMGQETKLDDTERDYSNEHFSFKRKMELILEKLVNFKNSTFRIHSGETPDSFNNSLLILSYLEEIVDERGYQLPPPEIRIGHGLYFNNETEYIRLLKKFNCIIEINASSNISLSNIEMFDEIPYMFYYTNKVNMVISTDGHGMYGTDTQFEDEIARTYMGDKAYKDGIVDFDREVLKSKGGR